MEWESAFERKINIWKWWKVNSRANNKLHVEWRSMLVYQTHDLLQGFSPFVNKKGFQVIITKWKMKNMAKDKAFLINLNLKLQKKFRILCRSKIYIGERCEVIFAKPCSFVCCCCCCCRIGCVIPSELDWNPYKPVLRCSCKWTKLVLNDCEQCSLPGIKRDHTCQIYLCVCAYCFVHYMNFTVEQKTSSDSSSIENCCKQCKNIGFIFRQNPKPKESSACYSTVCKEIKDSVWVSMQARNWFGWRKKILCCRSRYRCRRYDDDILNLHNRIRSLFNGFCRDWTSFHYAYVAQSHARHQSGSNHIENFTMIGWLFFIHC